MKLYMAILPTLMVAFGASWMLNLFRDFMNQSTGSDVSIQPVEVVNLHDIAGRK